MGHKHLTLHRVDGNVIFEAGVFHLNVGVLPLSKQLGLGSEDCLSYFYHGGNHDLFNNLFNFLFGFHILYNQIDFIKIFTILPL
jgi:hypothetical protein